MTGRMPSLPAPLSTCLTVTLRPLAGLVTTRAIPHGQMLPGLSAWPAVPASEERPLAESTEYPRRSAGRGPQAAAAPGGSLSAEAGTSQRGPLPLPLAAPLLALAAVLAWASACAYC